MTIVDNHRDELAKVIEREVDDVVDPAHLVDDLGLDSLAMLSLLTWLETKGVTVDSQNRQPTTVGEVLSLLGRTNVPGLSVQLREAGLTPASAADFVVAPRGDSASLAPVLSNHGVRLTPVTPDDMRFLYALSSQPETCYRWRYRGAPPPIEKFAADLWSQVLVQFVARRAGDGEPIGHLVSYGADLAQRYAYVGAVFLPAYTGTGLAAQVVSMFVRYLFHTFPMRKLYLEVPGFNWPQVRSGEGRLFEVEGVMKQHEFYGDRYWDRYLCAIYPSGVPTMA